MIFDSQFLFKYYTSIANDKIWYQMFNKIKTNEGYLGHFWFLINALKLKIVIHFLH